MYCFNWNRKADPVAFHHVHFALNQASDNRVPFTWTANVLDNELRLPHLDGVEPPQHEGRF
jgi:hypothetical protein